MSMPAPTLVPGPSLDGFDLLPGTLLGGDFRIDGRLGAGGVGVVYRGRQLSADRPVAVKVLGAVTPTGEQLQRFAREARAVADIRHPGVVELVHVGRDRGLTFLVMELVDGQTVRDWLAESTASLTPALPPTLVIWGADTPTDTYRPPPPKIEQLHTSDHVRRAVEIVRDTARAVGAAHARQVVHRDLKPDNVMLAADGTVKVIDFGLSRAYADATLTATGNLIGTPLYMAPEQLSGHPPGPAADVWALGVMLYELLTGSPPALAVSYEAALRNVLYRPPVPVNRVNPTVDRRLAAAVHAALSRDEKGRYPTADAFAADLDRWLTGATVSAPDYRYRFDAREVVAERPQRVTVAGHLLLGMAAVFLLLTLASVQTASPVGLLSLLFAVVMLAGGVGVLRGRRAAGWVATAGVLGIAAYLLQITAWFTTVRSAGNLTQLVMGGVQVFIGGLLVWSLASDAGRHWFRLAAARRAEFRATARM